MIEAPHHIDAAPRPGLQRLRAWIFRFAWVIALALALPGSGIAQGHASDDTPAGTIATESSPADDSRMERRLRGILGELDGFGQVEVRVTDGIIHLSGEVPDNAARARLDELARRIDGVVAVENQVSVTTDLEQRLTPALERLGLRLKELWQSAPLLLIALLTGGLIAMGGWWLAGRLPLLRRLAPNAFVAEVYRMVARLLFVVLGLLVALEILDATALLGAVLGAAGVAGLAVGFAVRDSVENFIASLMLSLRQPFRPNDFVEIEGSEGRVARLTSRATILISPDGNHIRIPNSTVFKGRIVNYTRDPERRFSFTLGVDADADLGAALATGVEAIKRLPFVLDNPPVGAWVQDVGDSNVLLTFTGWVDQTRTDFLKARGEAVRSAKVALESAGFGLPEPIYRVRLDSAEAALPATGNVTGPDSVSPSPDHDGDARPAAAPPPEADPSTLDDPTEDAVDRERQATDAGRDLLGENPRSE